MIMTAAVPRSWFHVPGSCSGFRSKFEVRCSTFWAQVQGTAAANHPPNVNTNEEPGTRNLELECAVLFVHPLRSQLHQLLAQAVEVEAELAVAQLLARLLFLRHALGGEARHLRRILAADDDDA